MSYRSTTQGRCRPCAVAFRWQGRPLLKRALCPFCKQPLSRTSRHLKSNRWDETHPLRAV